MKIFDAAQFAQPVAADRPRIVIKVGSSLLAQTPSLRPRYAFMHGLLSDIAALQHRGYDVVLASSGSVALGLNLLRADTERAGVQEKQAAAACGQPILLNAYKQVALEHGCNIAQVLVTLEDMEDPRRFLNTKNTVHSLLDLGVLPIVNENDTVTTEEIRVGDNDRLAAKVAQMIQAETLVILTSVDGLYDRNPEDPGAQLIETVEDVSGYLDVTQGTNSLGSGGMFTKMQAANMAQNVGCETIIARGVIDRPVLSALEGVRPRTRCVAKTTPGSAWAVWLTDRLQMAGSVTLSQSAADALEQGRDGVLCTDILSVHQHFKKGDVLHVYDEQGVERARGLSNFSSEEAALVASNPSADISQLLGFKAEPVLMNRKNLVVLGDHHLAWEQPEKKSTVIAA